MTNISCPKCGATISEDSLFCKFCGAAVVDNVGDVLKERALLEIQKEKNAEDLRIKTQIHQMQQRNLILKIAMMVIGVGAAIFLVMLSITR